MARRAEWEKQQKSGACKMYLVSAVCEGTKIIVRALKKKLGHQRKNWDINFYALFSIYSLGGKGGRMGAPTRKKGIVKMRF